MTHTEVEEINLLLDTSPPETLLDMGQLRLIEVEVIHKGGEALSASRAGPSDIQYKVHKIV